MGMKTAAAAIVRGAHPSGTQLFEHRERAPQRGLGPSAQAGAGFEHRLRETRLGPRDQIRAVFVEEEGEVSQAEADHVLVSLTASVATRGAVWDLSGGDLIRHSTQIDGRKGEPSPKLELPPEVLRQQPSPGRLVAFPEPFEALAAARGSSHTASS